MVAEIETADTLEKIVWWDYGFGDIIRHPIRACSMRSTYREVVKDLSLDDKFQKVFPADQGDRRIVSFFAPLISGMFLVTVPHEYLHATAGKLLGYASKIGFTLNPFMPGYTQFSSPLAPLDGVAISAAPYVLTGVGAWLVDKSKKKDLFRYYMLGSGALVAHMGGIFGDFYSIGKTAAYGAANSISHVLGSSDLDTHKLAVTIPMFVGSAYLGGKAMSLSYRLAKAGAHTVQRAGKGIKNLFSGK